MPKYMIERELPGAGKLTRQDLHDMAARSNKVLSNLGPEIRWLDSYVAEDKIYCIYVAPDEDIILEHARCGGFPVTRVSVVSTMMDPSTGE
jgi:Protein of unknown function (DUF4242)